MDILKKGYYFPSIDIDQANLDLEQADLELELNLKGIEDVILEIIATEICNPKKTLTEENSIKRRRRYPDTVTFEETTWGKLIAHPDVRDPTTKLGKIFRRRFRLPFPLFEHLVQVCTDMDIFKTKGNRRFQLRQKF